MKTMKWLLKRELWEHKGALVWAPIVAGALIILIMSTTAIWGLAQGGFHGEVDFDGHRSISAAFDAMPAAEKAEKIGAVAGSYMALGAPLVAMMSIIILFYCIASMYDERRDRSILFWKSLPVSDTETVLSKLIIAVVVSPLITIAATIVFSLIVMLILGIVLAFNGINLIGPVLSSSSFYLLPLQVLALLPVYALWALPTVGWLMLVSAWAKSKAFLWAFGIPLVTLALMAWFNHMIGLRIDMDMASEIIIGRGLGSMVPGSWFLTNEVEQTLFLDASQRVFSASSLLAQSWAMFAKLQMWVGIAAGAAMIFGAIRLRRWKDEG